MRRSKRDVSPTTLKRMPLECSFATSWSSARAKRSIRIETSSAGRRQFSLENAKSVRYSTPCSIAARTEARTDSTPLRCPATRGSSRLFAQRPLPSMMMAICRGTIRGSGMTRVELANIATRLTKRVNRVRVGGASDRHQVDFFRLQEAVDLGDEVIGQPLQVIVRAPFLVFRALLVLEQLLQMFVRVAPHVAHGDLRRFRLLVHDLGQFLPAFLCERGHRDADHLAAR